MKLFTKIFICAIAVITLALTVLECVIVSWSFRNTLERETDNCMSRYQFIKQSLLSAMILRTENGELSGDDLDRAVDSLSTAVSSSDMIAVLNESGTPLMTTFGVLQDYSAFTETRESETVSYTEKADGEYLHTVCGCFEQSGRTLTLVFTRNISSVFEEKHQLERRFMTVYIITEIAASLVMAVLSFAVSRPIIRLAGTTERFAQGRLSERSEVRGGGEIGELSKSFNQMADTIESNIASLELSVKQKDDFTASFAHELKTPLTSVIGYADMIYQKPAMSREKIHEAAGYIVNEGMRLEALSLKLMELFVLEKQDFTLVEMEASEVLRDIAETVRPLIDKKGAELILDADAAYIRVELDLFKTLVMNLIDNSAKAGAKTIRLSGIDTGDKYRISVSDNGRGIPKDQLGRITEAFYMVDKSRSRRDHGAGLGLSIASRIAKVHGTTLEFESEPGVGTTVSILLGKENAEDEA
ncbi:MAG: HAMP domain-containing histidine kinase [Clostridiales bacterium]|nr:HAMP domain-containing histidine kinase [Clostridiales bacterium]